jgi:hypothetical protein
MTEGGNEEMKKLLLFVFCILFFTATNALAVEIAWMHVQHREYGSGKSFNRLGFGLIDDRGYYITNNKSIIEIKLFNADKKELKLSAVKFDSVEEVSGSYDYKNSQWYYSKGWQFDSWFSAGILDSLNPGMYGLKVTTADGKSVERTFAYNNRVALPIIDSNSFQFDTDQSGNLFWRWNIPIELGYLSLSHKTRARAAIEIYENNKSAGYLSIILPVHMGYVFIPRDVVQSMNQKGNHFEMKISLETRDKNNRTYSKPLIVNEKLPPISGR